MARTDYIAELARKPPGFKLALLGGIIAVLGLFYWQFMFSGLSDDLDSAKARNRSLRQKSDKLSKDKAEWDRLVLQKKELDAELTKNQVSLPSSSELPSFFYHLQKQAAGAGVKLDNWSRGKESPVESYIKVPVAMEVTGTFYQINNYFKLLYETDRIITIEDLKLTYLGSKDEEIKLKANFTASTFRLPDKPPQGDTAPPAGKPGAAKPAAAGAKPPAKGAAPAKGAEKPPASKPQNPEKAGIKRLTHPEVP